MTSKLKSTGQIFDQQRRCDRLLNEVTTAQINKADPRTGGNQLLAHNWGNDAAQVILSRHQNRQHFLYDLFNKYYKLAFYREYPDHCESKKHTARNRKEISQL